MPRPRLPDQSERDSSTTLNQLQYRPIQGGPEENLCPLTRDAQQYPSVAGVNQQSASVRPFPDITSQIYGQSLDFDVVRDMNTYAL